MKRKDTDDNNPLFPLPDKNEDPRKTVLICLRNRGRPDGAPVLLPSIDLGFGEGRSVLVPAPGAQQFGVRDEGCAGVASFVVHHG
jgi:hypothetical protein